MAADHRFACPGCGEQIVVNAAMRQTILEEGCVVCGAAATGEDFRRV